MDTKEQPEEQRILKQDLSEEARFSGVYMVNLLFKEPAGDPDTETILEKLSERLGAADPVSRDTGLRSFALKEHTVTYQQGPAPSMVMLTGCEPVKRPLGDSLARTQFWDVPDGTELLDSCPYQVMVSDMMAAGLRPVDRAVILGDWLDIVLGLYPSCAAVFFSPLENYLPPDSCGIIPIRDGGASSAGRLTPGFLISRGPRTKWWIPWGSTPSGCRTYNTISADWIPTRWSVTPIM
ncbi:hypothetical protein [Breznakiella homolactica]|uniref:Uncharacterized protein n=1 Tax=Breznakiella homolactica TaxID=2798577 RepID=A0A7T7XM39_9SPIR|nr:hypothetical protein [Breznakiella homolactica]QQO08783.1 hypothetical protein JFL75_17920 [Breznakiella homolactica]